MWWYDLHNRLHMATVFKKANSRFWYAQFYDSKGKRVARSTGKEKKREAQKAAEDFESEERKSAGKNDFSEDFKKVVDAAARDAEVGSLTLARAEEFIQRLKRLANPDFEEVMLEDLWERWMRVQEQHVRPITIQSFKDDWKLLSPHFPAGTLGATAESLKEPQIRQAMKKAADAGRRGSTVNKAFLNFRRCLEWAVSEKLLQFNPARQVRALPQTDSRERGPFTLEEVRKLIAAARSDEWAGAILIGAHTGLRMGDIASLSSSHIDGKRLVIRPSKTSRRRKNVTVPLSPAVLKWISDRTGDFFPSIKPLSIARRAVIFTRTMEKAGVPHEVTATGGIVLSRSFHSLRHTFTSWLADADVQSDVRQKLTGHSSAKIHALYSHHDESLDRAVEKLPEI